MFEVLMAPRDMRFGEVETILHAYGYKLFHVKGSHFRYKREGARSLTLVSHNRRIKRIYIKKIFNYLLYYL